MIGHITRDDYTKEELMKMVHEERLKKQLLGIYLHGATLKVTTEKDNAVSHSVEKRKGVSGYFYRQLRMNIKLGTDWQKDVFAKGLAIVAFRSTPRLTLAAEVVITDEVDSCYNVYKVDTLYVDSRDYSNLNVVEETMYIVTDNLQDEKVLIYAGTTIVKARSSMLRQQKKTIKKLMGL